MKNMFGMIRSYNKSIEIIYKYVNVLAVNSAKNNNKEMTKSEKKLNKFSLLLLHRATFGFGKLLQQPCH